MASKNDAYRDLARSHHAAAGYLLATGAPAQARHACLELRMALECLSYDLLKLYRDDVQDGVLELWQAGAIFDALLELDPGIERPLEFQVAGEDGTFDSPLLHWREERLDVKWAKKAYYSLGHFLHERTFLEIERGVVDDPDKIRSRALAIHSHIGTVLESSGWNLRLKTNSKMECDCGGDAVFGLSPLQVKSRARRQTCGADYEIRVDPTDPDKVRARRTKPSGG